MDSELSLEQESLKICCTDCPSEFILDRNTAKEYFRQYGKLKRITIKPKLRVCTVEYADHEGFMKALNFSGDYNGQTFDVSVDNSPVKSRKKVPKDPDPNWLADPEVRAELEAMGADFISDSKKYNLRPEAMIVDPIMPKKAPKLKRVWKLEGSPSTIKKKKHTVEAEVRKSLSIPQEHKELVNMLNQPAITVEEKYRVLDARDKLMRIKGKQNASLKSSATVGVCPDMCPEKERLMRVTQHQVALYEQEEGSKNMNPALAIKQYSRSSADQETPLPHELRPVSVLQMTMGYLMHKIIDLCETDDVNLAEWYHFLWDRTRGIRKDITQQELCSQGSVELVEQCARFHIHCSARLVAEDPSVFDQKINTENLTKCLQTLKYMYHDLQVKDESCPNEAEFRGYIILLNLNDGNFMWEVQQLREEIQKSKAVKFAVNIYSALDKNNYVKFFKLVSSTTYLNACILMRYFVQVRIRALKTLVKCFVPRISKTLYPLEDLTNILAFEDIESTIDFLNTFGLTINNENTHVILAKNVFALPDYSYTIDRSIKFVESKRICSVGEVICGKELPLKLYENHIPQNSFDDKGYVNLKGYLNDSDLELPKQDTPTIDLTSQTPVQKSKEEPIKTVFSSPVIENIFGKKSELPNIFGKSSVPSVRPLQQSLFKIKAEDVQKPAETLGNDEVDKPPENLKPFWSNNFTKTVTTTPSFPLFSQGNILAQTLVQDKPEEIIFNITQACSVFSPNIFSQSVTNWSENESVFQKIEENKSGFPVHSRDITSSCNTSNTEFDIPVTQPVIQSAPLPSRGFDEKFVEEQEKLKKAEMERQEKLRQEIEEKQKHIQMEKQRLVEEQQRKLQEKIRIEKLKQEQEHKEALRKKEEQLRRQKEEQLRTEQKQKREEERLKDLEIKTCVKDLLSSMVTDVERKIRDEKLTEINKSIKRRKLLNIFTNWKSIVIHNKRKRKAMDCSPVFISNKSLKQEADELYTKSQDLTLKYIKSYKSGLPFELSIVEDEKINKINLFELVYSAIKKRYYELDSRLNKSIFWKITISLPDDIEMKVGLNRIEETLDSYLQWEDRNGQTELVEQHKPRPSESFTYCIEKQKGFKIQNSDSNGIIFIAKDFNDNLQQRIFENLKEFGVFVKIPIVIILQNCDSSQAKLKTLIEEKIVSDYVILIDNLTPHVLTNLIDEGLIFLTGKIEKPPPLEMDTLKSFMTKYLCSEIWKRANSFTKWNSAYKNTLKNPNTVIKLYNEGLNKLKKIILNKACLEYAAFPEIFKSFLKSEIPDYLPCSYIYFPNFWKNKEYFSKLTRIINSFHLPLFEDTWPPSNEFELELNLSKYCTKVFQQPEKPFYKIMSILLQDVDPNENFHDVENTLWTDVIELLGTEKSLETNFSLTGTEFANKSVFNQYVVVYDSTSLDDYNKSDWFYITNPLIKREMKQQYRTPEKKKEDLNTSIEHDFSIDLDKTLTEVTNQLQNTENISKMKMELAQFNYLMTDLETSIDIHRKISRKFEETLKHAIEEH